MKTVVKFFRLDLRTGERSEQEMELSQDPVTARQTLLQLISDFNRTYAGRTQYWA